MKTAEEHLHEVYQKAYDSVKPGERYPAYPEQYAVEAIESYASLRASEAIRVLPWVKAIDRLPQHMVMQFIKIDGKPYVGYYDYSLKRFMCPNMGPSGLSIENIEWLDEENVKSSSEAIREKEEESEKPDFNQWLETENGKQCNNFENIGEQKYLTNRLSWAFDAGRDRMWQQYLNEKRKVAAKDKEIEQLRAVLENIALAVKHEASDLIVRTRLNTAFEVLSKNAHTESSGNPGQFTGPVVGVEDDTPFTNRR